MRAVVFTGPRRAAVVERPRPQVVGPDDAIVMVTSAGVAPWDIESHQSGPSASGGGLTVPGGEFAGNIVELGPAVEGLKINDLVFALSGWKEPGGAVRVFGRDGLDGGHADYVRVPRAGSVLVKTTAAAEERSLLAGGSLALGALAAEAALSSSDRPRVIVTGCDPLGIAALAWLKSKGTAREVLAFDNHDARLALARRYGAVAVDVRDATAANRVEPADAVISGGLFERPGTAWTAGAARPGGLIVFAEPDGVERWSRLDVPVREGVRLAAAEWPSRQFAERVATQLAIRRLDAGGIVSHVVPLDLAADAYAQAAGRGPGVQKVLLKP
jgi:threonine dehydrogenase-like Zn-dependent dehydrogenase